MARLACQGEERLSQVEVIWTNMGWAKSYIRDQICLGYREGPASLGKIFELLATEGTDPIPTKLALVKRVGQEEGQSFPAMLETSALVSNSPDILFLWIKRSFKGLEAVISCTQKARLLDPNPLGPLAWEDKVLLVW